MTEQSQNSPCNSWRLNRHLIQVALALSLSFGLTACDRSTQSDGGQTVDSGEKVATKRGTNPVESKDGMAYIPIDDTAFLIPEKTWLKSYGRKATDGSVSTIILHATVPDVQPWSQERHEEMYWPAGPGKKLLIYIHGGSKFAKDFHVSRRDRSPGEFVEEPSDQAVQGLRRFRRLWLAYTDEEAKKDQKRFGSKHVESMKASAGKPMMDKVYYELVYQDRVKYFIYCDDGSRPRQIWLGCHLIIPWTPTIAVDVEFMRNEISTIVSMVDRLGDRLREFEAAGVARRAAKSQSKQ